MKTIRLRVLERIQTTDAALHTTKDVLLTCPTAAEWTAYSRSVAKVDLGKIWDGFEATLGALNDEQRTAIYDRLDAHRELEDAKKTRKPVGALDSAPGDLARGELYRQMDAEDHRKNRSINEVNAKFWAERQSA